ncbi:metal ion efflux membrane fusion protein family [Sphingobium sp. ba1]|jgi:cobalt-zinc-cadmium efflux system membrane fusion protein|uniref:efflux RND transporter periplasmic adaptor subunit n=1 Tax=Sphingobium sp. ba1 TaxID=1522072 RepID=UPI000504E20D|nr:efflux RND transporter periplasmic adaptor subunit [Sphingobium sp. ba1]KFL45309.1 metal ion efflux membrane fusion protein family [Sphingobium sp. ba1]
MMTQDKRLLGGVAAAVLVAAAGGFTVARWTADTPAAPAAEATKPEAGEAEAAPSDTLAMNAETIKRTGITTETVNQGGLAAEIVSQATVAPSPMGEAIVTARAGGAVTRVFKRLGDAVRRGEALAIVESRDAAQIAADRTAAGAKATLAQRNLAREHYLYGQKVSPRVDLERAQAEAASAAAEARRASVAAGAANITSDGRGVVVASPISGRVTSENVSLGAFVQPETELFRVADPSQIQIEAAVGPAEAQRLAPGDRAIIDLPDGTTTSARVRAVTPTLSGETRAATAVLDVIGGRLQPGLAVRVRLFPSRGGASSAIVVPEEAVQSLNARDVVFVRTPKGFKAVPVTTGQRSAGRIEIVSGLAAGQTIATKNAFLLKAELGKGAGEEE